MVGSGVGALVGVLVGSGVGTFVGVLVGSGVGALVGVWLEVGYAVAVGARLDGGPGSRGTETGGVFFPIAVGSGELGDMSVKVGIEMMLGSIDGGSK